MPMMPRISNTSKLFSGSPRMRNNPLTGFLWDLIMVGLESFGKYYSSYLGKVADVNDPASMNRIKVIIPDVTGGSILHRWAYPKGFFAGEGYGIQMLPRVGDIVWVEFEKGNPENPIWSHSYFGEYEKPKGPKYESPKNIFLVTPSKISILVDEENNRVEILLPDGKSGIEIKDKVISIINPTMISLGEKDKSQYSAVLGEKILDALDTLTQGLDDITKSLDKDLTASALANQPYLKYINMKVGVPLGVIKLASAKNKLKTILSKRITLE